MNFEAIVITSNLLTHLIEQAACRHFIQKVYRPGAVTVALLSIIGKGSAAMMDSLTVTLTPNSNR